MQSVCALSQQDSMVLTVGLRRRGSLTIQLLLTCVCLLVLQRLCLNGSTGQEVVVRKDLQNVEALTFDPISRLLYWVDAGAQKIEV